MGSTLGTGQIGFHWRLIAKGCGVIDKRVCGDRETEEEKKVTAPMILEIFSDYV